jgi:hypothetical protein
MISWFEQYDRDTYMVPFEQVQFSRYNPLSSKDHSFFTSHLKGHQSFEMIIH